MQTNNDSLFLERHVVVENLETPLNTPLNTLKKH